MQCIDLRRRATLTVCTDGNVVQWVEHLGLTDALLRSVTFVLGFMVPRGSLLMSLLPLLLLQHLQADVRGSEVFLWIRLPF